MDDQDLEQRLRAYRPAAPPAALRGRIVDARSPRARATSIVAWLPAAAALMLTFVFYWLAATERQMLGAVMTPMPPITQEIAAARDREEPQP